MSKNNEIIETVLTMDDAQLARFLRGLNPRALEYLEIVLAKADDATLSKLLKK